MIPFAILAAVYATYLMSRQAAQNAANQPAPIVPLISDQQPGILGGTMPNATAGARRPHFANVPSTAASGIPNSDPRTLAFQQQAADHPEPAPGFFAQTYAPVWHMASDVSPHAAAKPRSGLVHAPAGLTVLFDSGRRGAPQSSTTPAPSGGCSGGCGGCGKRARCSSNGMNIGVFQPSAQQMADWAETMRTSGSLSNDGLAALHYLTAAAQSSDPTPAAAPSYTHF